MQVAADPPPLLLTGDHQPLTALLQLLGELPGAHGAGGLTDQIGQQLLVATAQPAAQPAHGQHDTAHLPLAVGDGERAHLCGLVAVDGDQALTRRPVDLETHEPDPERGGHGIGHRRELLARLIRALQRRGQPGHDVVRRLALAEQHATDRGREALSQWPVEHRRQQQHDHHDLPFVEVVSEHGTEAGDDQQVDGDERHRQHSEDQRRVEQVLHRHESGPHDADRHRDARKDDHDEEHHVVDEPEVGEQREGQRDSADLDRPQEPAGPVALRADRSPVTHHGRGHRDQDAYQRQGVGDGQHRIGEASRQRQGAGVEVEPSGHVHLGDEAVGWRHDDEQSGRCHHAERRAPGGAPASDEEPPRREDQQQRGHRHRQERPEPVEEPQGSARAGQRLVGPDAVADPRLRQCVEAPEDPEPTEQPTEAAGIRAADEGEHDACADAEHDPEPGEGPPRAGCQLDTRAGRRGGNVEGGRDRQQQHGHHGEEGGYDDPLAHVVPALSHSHILPVAAHEAR